MLAVGVTFRAAGSVVAAPLMPYTKLVPGVPPVCVTVPSVMLVGLMPVDVNADRRIMLPALLPAPLVVAVLVLMVPVTMAPPELVLVLPLDMNTPPPNCVVLPPSVA